MNHCVYRIPEPDYIYVGRPADTSLSASRFSFACDIAIDGSIFVHLRGLFTVRSAHSLKQQRPDRSSLLADYKSVDVDIETLEPSCEIVSSQHGPR